MASGRLEQTQFSDFPTVSHEVIDGNWDYWEVEDGPLLSDLDAASASDDLGGFTILQHNIPPRKDTRYNQTRSSSSDYSMNSYNDYYVLPLSGPRTSRSTRGSEQSNGSDPITLKEILKRRKERKNTHKRFAHNFDDDLVSEVARISEKKKKRKKKKKKKRRKDTQSTSEEDFNIFMEAETFYQVLKYASLTLENADIIIKESTRALSLSCFEKEKLTRITTSITEWNDEETELLVFYATFIRKMAQAFILIDEPVVAIENIVRAEAILGRVHHLNIRKIQETSNELTGVGAEALQIYRESRR